jgi:hypothetical protein
VEPFRPAKMETFDRQGQLDTRICIPESRKGISDNPICILDNQRGILDTPIRLSNEVVGKEENTP